MLLTEANHGGVTEHPSSRCYDLNVKSIEVSEIAYLIILDPARELLPLIWIDDRLKTNEVGVWCDRTVEATCRLPPTIGLWTY